MSEAEVACKESPSERFLFFSCSWRINFAMLSLIRLSFYVWITQNISKKSQFSFENTVTYQEGSSDNQRYNPLTPGYDHTIHKLRTRLVPDDFDIRNLCTKEQRGKYDVD